MGTVALNVITYADMLLRARPSGQVPAEVPHLAYGATTATVHNALS